MRNKLLTVILLLATVANAQRQEYDIKQWEFSRDSVNWQSVNVPHDWAISGPFDKKWDLQRVAITQNGETEATEKSGRSGALPWIGRGYYRTQVHFPKDCGHVELVFDGAMAEPVVRVNGQVAGGWKYGYNAFRVDITPYLKVGAVEVNPFCHLVEEAWEANIEVSLENLEESSRWYPGAGLYRPVKAVVTGKDGSATRIDAWSVYAQTIEASREKAVVRMSAQVIDPQPGQTVLFILRQHDGVFAASQSALIDAEGRATADLTVENPKLWWTDDPYLYTINVDLTSMGDDGLLKIHDVVVTKTGLRTVSVSKERGFELNGVSMQLQGVCLHHDLGPLGAAINKDALFRQIRILKDMGCNAIRTAHNMPSTWQMEICDSLGMMVMAESFDMWIYPKCKNGYARFFKEWAEKDITNLVLNHRNHPSIVMWSIGNEIPEQWDANEGVFWSRRLQDLIHRLDPSRPVTQGMDRPDDALKSGFAQVMDVPGFNYRVHKYDSNIRQLPCGFLLGCETASTVSSRGVYKFPVVVTNQGVYSDGQCSSYDTEYCSWSNLPDDDFLMADERPWYIGQFVWTGFDYLGEPTPYDEYWPSRSSYFGICDLAGLPKDRYYLYRSQWNKRDHTLHILPHWTWPGREGEVTPVYVYTDSPEAELFVNGKSQGRRRKDTTANQLICNPDADASPHRGGKEGSSLLDRYRLRWNDVVYEPGELRVVAYDRDGQPVGEQKVCTAGEPKSLHFELEPYDHELAFIRVSLVDEKGNFVPTANDELEFEVEGGGGFFKAVCNGDPTSLEPFTEPRMRLFNGQLVVIIRKYRPLHVTTLRVTDRQRRIKGSFSFSRK